MISPLVYILVLAWNHVEDTIECVSSLRNSDYDNFKIAVIDNGSTDNTSIIIKQKFPDVEIVASDKNLGVSGGYNFGLEHVINWADFVIISNNDIIVDSKMISELMHQMVKKEDLGIAMPKIYHYYGNRNKLWCTGAKWRIFPPMVKMMGMDKADKPEYGKLAKVEFAPSCTLLLRSSMVKKTGLFDTNFFFYNDDWDYSIRCRANGFSIYFVPEAKMWHKVSKSTQNSEKPRIWWVYYGRSTFRFYKKHVNQLSLMIFILWFILRESIKGNFSRIAPFIEGLKIERNLFIGDVSQ